MKTSEIIDIKKGEVELSDGSIKYIDNYILELEDRILKTLHLLQDFDDVDPNCRYDISGELLFKVMDKLEGRK